MRPGPEFLLRSYTFHRNGSFRLLQFHYGEESCSLPLYTVAARGRYRLRGGSWLTPAATEAEYTLTRVTVTAQSAEVADELAARVNATCPGQVSRVPCSGLDTTLLCSRPMSKSQPLCSRSSFSSLQVRRRWKPYREYVVLSASEEDGDALRPRNNLPPSEPSAPRPGSGSGPASGGWPHHGRQGRQQGRQQGRPADVDCLAALHAAFHELQLVRTQRRPLRGPRALRVKGAAAKGVAARAPRHELLLGDVHSRPDQRDVYRPTAFQVPLLRVDKALEERQVSPCRRQGVRESAPAPYQPAIATPDTPPRPTLATV